MLIPVRCFTCGNVLADKWLAYEELVKRERQHKHELQLEQPDAQPQRGEERNPRIYVSTLSLS